MRRGAPMEPWGRALQNLFSVFLLALFALPVVALWRASSLAEMRAAFAHESFVPAMRLSVMTSTVSMLLVLTFGLPLAWRLASSKRRIMRMLETWVELPIVLPPAVLGVGLLQAFGRNGMLGSALVAWGISIPFTETAVVLAQLLVSAPFFVQSATQAFRRVDPELVWVARSLGASPTRAFWRVVMPLCGPGLLAGASLAWARALGEFGATLLFAGNRLGVTQTMPLAIFTTLESDMGTAVVFSLMLAGGGVGLLLALRWGLGRPKTSGSMPA